MEATIEKPDTTYNGWTNYETWCVNLWLDNDEGSQDYWRERAEEILNEVSDELAGRADASYITPVERAALDLRLILKEEIEDSLPDLGASMAADLLGAALSEVNWYEIAQHMIADLDA